MKERLRAQVSIPPQEAGFGGDEVISVVRYSTDGWPDEVDDVHVPRDHPEVPASTAARDAALRTAGYNTVGRWQTGDDGDQDFITVVARTPSDPTATTAQEAG